MITDALLTFGRYVAGFFIGLLPSWNWQFPQDKVDAFTGFIFQCDLFAPVTELGWMVATSSTFILALIGAKYLIKLCDYVFDVIP